MRIYKVLFAHKRYGTNWSSQKVAVRGYVPSAIKRALRYEGKYGKNLRIEAVELLADTE